VTERPHDALFKAAFSVPAHAAGLLGSVLPRTIVDEISWETLTIVDGSFIDAELADRQSDLLFSAALGGTSALLYVLLEHQSSTDRDMPLRMLGYVVRILDRHRRDHPTESLPLVLPIVISHAPGGWTAPRDMNALFAPHPTSLPGVEPHVPSFEFILDDLSSLTNEDIKRRAIALFPRVVLWLLRDARDGERLLQNFADLGRAFFAAVHEPSGMSALMQVFRYLALVADDFHFTALRDTLQREVPMSDRPYMTHAERLRGEGRAEARAEVLSKLLTLKFGPLPAEVTTRVTTATAEDLDRWIERVLVAERLDAIFA